MSDTDEMTRLMRHAADLLKAARDQISTAMNLSAAESAKVVRAVAAMAHGEAILLLVAASVAPEGTATAQKLIDGFRNGEYDNWAEVGSWAPLTFAEQKAVRVYLRELTQPTVDRVAQ